MPRLLLPLYLYVKGCSGYFLPVQKLSKTPVLLSNAMSD